MLNICDFYTIGIFMAHARLSQSYNQLLELANANQWQAIQSTEDALINETIKIKSLVLLVSITQKKFDAALRQAIVGKAPYTLITLLIPLRTNINSGSSKQHNRTSLHFAAQLGRVDIIPELITAGAYVNMVDETYFTPAHLACQNGHAHAAYLLAQAGAYTTGNVSPSELIPKGLKSKFSMYLSVSQQLVSLKIMLPSGRNSKFKTLVEPNNVVAALSSSLPPEDESGNTTLEGMAGEGRIGGYDKILAICAMRGILTLTVNDYINLDKTYCDVMPMHITQMLLRFGNANNDNLLISCTQHLITKVTNLALQWAEVEALSQTEFSLTFRGSGMDAFFLLSDDADLICESEYIRKATDGKLIIDDKNLSTIISDFKNHPIKKMQLPNYVSIEHSPLKLT
jgi:hypothetical protein